MIEFRSIDGLDKWRFGSDGSAWSRRGLGREWKPMKLQPNKDGYLIVSLGSKIRNVGVHRLILMAFVGPCPAGMECRHIDGNPSNNRLDNLKWGTRQENADDMIQHGTTTQGERSGMAKLNEMKVREIRRLHNEERMTYRDIGNKFGVVHSTIKDIVNRNTWKHIV